MSNGILIDSVWLQPLSKEMGFKGTYSIESGGPEPYALLQTILDRLMEYL
jgi:hypothetical protein